jgi:hypothetical protein
MSLTTSQSLDTTANAGVLLRTDGDMRTRFGLVRV